MKLMVDDITIQLHQTVNTAIKTTGEAGGMHHAFKAIILAASKDALNKFANRESFSGRRLSGLFLCLCILATRKRVYVFFKR